MTTEIERSEREAVEKRFREALNQIALYGGLEEQKDCEQFHADALSLLDRLSSYREALEAAAKRFRHYEELHAAKATPDGLAKAQSNADMADLCERALGASSHG